MTEKLIKYGNHVFRFKNRHPVLYRLYYRRWFMWHLSGTDLEFVKTYLKRLDDANKGNWLIFAEDHPVQMLLVIFVSSLAEGFVKLFTKLGRKLFYRGD